MCDWHDGFSTEGEAETYGWSMSHNFGTAGETSEAPTRDIFSDVDAGRSHADSLHLDIMLNALRKHLQRCVRRLTVAQFTELRRRYEDIWLEVLEEL